MTTREVAVGASPLRRLWVHPWALERLGAVRPDALLARWALLMPTSRSRRRVPCDSLRRPPFP